MRKPGTTTAILVAIDELRAEVRHLRAEVLQRRAQEARRGLWADAEPVPPWKWGRER